MSIYEFPHPKDKVVILKRIPVFASCSEEQLLLIAERTRLLEAKKGEHIYHEGGEADAFYIVISGRLRVYSTAGGKDRTVGVLHNDDAFGEISLLTGERHSASIQALNDTLILQLSKNDFDEVINRIPSLVLYLSRLLSKRLRMRERSGESLAATIASIFSAAPKTGKSFFSVALAAALYRETRHDIVVVDMRGAAVHPGLLYPAEPVKHLQLPREASQLTEDAVERALVAHPSGFHAISLKDVDQLFAHNETIAPLLNILAKRFNYVLLDLPSNLDPLTTHTLMQSDLVYFITDPIREHVLHTKAMIKRLQGSMHQSENRVKIVLNKSRSRREEEPSFLHVLFSPTQRLRTAEAAQLLEMPIDFALPLVQSSTIALDLDQLTALLNDSAQPYTITLRRIARELSGRLVGLALGSGAALGMAHVGVLKVLERERIPIDIIAGTSIGALIGGLWAAGRSAEELEQMAIRFKNPWNTRKLFLFDISIPLPSILLGILVGAIAVLLSGPLLGIIYGIISVLIFTLIIGPLAGGPMRGTFLARILEEDFENLGFEDTRLPIKIVASDPYAREPVVFDTGSLAEAVRASTSIPGIFKPVMHQGRMCIDGGVLNPIPVNVLKRAGADRIIAVNVFPTAEDVQQSLIEKRRHQQEEEERYAQKNFVIRFFRWVRGEISRSMQPLVFDIIMRAMQSMEHHIAEVACQQANLTLRPTIPGAYWLEFYHPEKYIQRGEEIALQHLPELKRLAGMRDEGAVSELER